jgi:hypothetical protein
VLQLGQPAGRLGHAPRAVRVDAQRHVLGPIAARIAASRCASSSSPAFALTHANPARTAAAASSALSASALTWTNASGASVSRSHTGLEARRPARSHSAMSTAASACGSGSAARQASTRRTPGCEGSHSRMIGR